MNEKARMIIESALSPVIHSGKAIENLNLMVCPRSEAAKQPSVETRFGTLRIVPGEYIPMGYCYLIEKPLTPGGISFRWVVAKMNQKRNRHGGGDAD